MLNGGSSHLSQGASNMLGGINDKLIRSEPWIFRAMQGIRANGR